MEKKMHELFADMPGVALLGRREPSKKIAIASLVPAVPMVTVATLCRILNDADKIMARVGTLCADRYFASHNRSGLPE